MPLSPLFRTLPDVDWPTFADEERVTYNAVTGKMEGRTLPLWAWRATSSLAESFPLGRYLATASQSITSGTLRLSGGAVLPAGKTVNTITFVSSGTAAVTPTNQWFCLVDQSLNVLAKTVDDLTTAWAGNTAKTLTISGGYTPTADIAVFMGIMVAAATPPSINGIALTTALAAMSSPMPYGNSTTGLTTPGSLGATTVAPAAAGAFLYASANS